MREDLPLLFPTPTELILWDVVEEHLQQAEFLLGHWRASLTSHVQCLDDLSGGVEHRLRAHLAGLAVGGSTVAERLLYPDSGETPGSQVTTIAALGMLETGSRDSWRELFDVLAFTQEEEQRRAIIRAIAMFEAPTLDSVLLDAFERARSPRAKAALLEALAERCIDPGDALEACFDMTYGPLRVAAVKAVGRAGRRELLPLIEEHMEDGESSLGDAALEAGLFLGSGRAWTSCLARASSGGRSGARALLGIAVLGGRGEHEVVHAALEDEQTRCDALWALGFTGTVDSVERCLPHLDDLDARCARLAAEAVAATTGLEWTADEDFQEEPPEEGDLPGTELDHGCLEGGRLPDATHLLPLPRPEAFSAWWEANRSGFEQSKRYLGGEVRTAACLLEALRTAPMRRRHGLALELALRTGGRRHVATGAFTAKQLRQIEELDGLQEGELGNRFGES